MPTILLTGLLHNWTGDTRIMPYILHVSYIFRVSQSDANLILTRNFKCSFMVIKPRKPRGNIVAEIQAPYKYRSENIRTIFLLSQSILKDPYLRSLLPCGVLDIKSHFKDADDKTVNCVLLSVYTGHIINQNNNEITKAIRVIDRKFRQSLEMQEKFIEEFKLFPIAYLNDLPLTKLVDHLSKRLKVEIYTFTKGNCDGYFKLIHTTNNNHTDHKPIKVFINDDHCCYLADNINLEKRYSTFCDWCTRSITSDFTTHRCVRKKCFNCWRYFNKTGSANMKHLCSSHIIKDHNWTCQRCHKQIENNDCASNHKLLKKRYCQHIQYCVSCSTYYKSGSIVHTCGLPLCQICNLAHDKDTASFCRTTERHRRVAISETPFLMDINCDNGNLSIVTLVEIGNDRTFNGHTIRTFYQYNIANNDFCEYTISSHSPADVQQVSKVNTQGIKTVEDVLNSMEIQNRKPKFFCSAATFKTILSEVNLQEYKTIKSKDSVIYYMKHKYHSFLIMDQFLQCHPVFMLQLLDLNDINPFYLLTPTKIKTMSMESKLCLSVNDFLNVFHTSDISVVNFLLRNGEDNCLQLSYITKLAFLSRQSLLRLHIAALSLMALEGTMQKIVEKYNNLERPTKITVKNMYNYNSLASSIFDIFISAIKTEPLPILFSHTPGCHYNTSKYEISFVSCIIQNHKSQFPNHKIKSYVNATGEQYSVRNNNSLLSAGKHILQLTLLYIIYL